jgi:hypothetical protein
VFFSSIRGPHSAPLRFSLTCHPKSTKFQAFSKNDKFPSNSQSIFINSKFSLYVTQNKRRRKKLRNQKVFAALLIAVLVFAAQSLIAQDKVYKPLVNRWKPDQRIRVNFFDVVAGQANDGDKTAVWCFNPVQGTEFVNLENADKSCLKAQFGGLAAGFASTWDESLWAIEPVPGTEYVEIKNKSTGTYLHIQNGKLELGPREPGWLSSQWILTDNPGKVVSESGNSKDTEKGMTGLNLAKEAEKGASNVVTGMDKLEKGTDNLGKKISKKGDKGAAKVTKTMDKVEKGTDKVGQGIATESDKLTTSDINATKTEQGAAKTEQGMSGLASGMSKESDKLSKKDNSTDKNNANNANNAAVVTKIEEPKEAVYELKCTYAAGGPMKNTTITVTCDTAKTDGMGVTRGKVFFKQTFSTFTSPGGNLVVPFTSPRATKVLNFRFETTGSDPFTITDLILIRDKEQMAHWTTDGKGTFGGFCLSMGNKACSPYWTFQVEGNSAVKY